MKEAPVGCEQPVIAHRQAAEVAEPTERALHDPAPAIPPQASAVLVGGLTVVRPRRDDRLNTSLLEPAPEGVAVVAAVGDQPRRVCPRPPRPMRPGDFDRSERLGEERDLRRGRRV